MSFVTEHSERCKRWSVNATVVLWIVFAWEPRRTQSARRPKRHGLPASTDADALVITSICFGRARDAWSR